ncbi:iron-sulfur cluster assembly scaffold protein [Gracilibacillus alcaliphilus]|uniref:iron-sulfur cluster assembly scaffold protein n=1 Tax=Gracilibacillus alcaliphilus TaxID=1401441 RepID=UPI0030845412|nr:NifU-like protein involved in Fe-S cluster formation [Gracilibacillus alcaliphilus]
MILFGGSDDVRRFISPNSDGSCKIQANYGMLSGEAVIDKIHYKNPTCGGVMILYLQVGEKGIEDLSFEGEGCSISMPPVP